MSTSMSPPDPEQVVEDYIGTRYAKRGELEGTEAKQEVRRAFFAWGEIRRRLRAADAMGDAINDAVQAGAISSRSPMADARRDYSDGEVGKVDDVRPGLAEEAERGGAVEATMQRASEKCPHGRPYFDGCLNEDCQRVAEGRVRAFYRACGCAPEEVEDRTRQRFGWRTPGAAGRALGEALPGEDVEVEIGRQTSAFYEVMRAYTEAGAMFLGKKVTAVVSDDRGIRLILDGKHDDPVWLMEAPWPK